MLYTAAIGDGMSRNAGGETTIEADSIRDARTQAEEWADGGDYPASAPVTVSLSLTDPSGKVVDRWDHRVPDSTCSGDPAGDVAAELAIDLPDGWVDGRSGT
jgi:hypothetical protein